jgi:hypothetical protein
LVQLCTDFSEWFKDWHPHKFLGSATPTLAYLNKAVPLVPKTAKDVPENIMIKRFEETKVTAYRIKKVV